MAVDLIEKTESRERRGQGQTLHYVLTGQGNAVLGGVNYSIVDDAQVWAYLKLALPTSFNGLGRDDDSFDIRPLYVDVTGGSAHWQITVNYKPGTPAGAVFIPTAGKRSFTFDFQGRQEHISSALANAARFPGTAPDFHGALNVTDRVEGLDIPCAGYNFAVTYYKNAADITTAYLGLLQSLANRVNHAAFTITLPNDQQMTFAAGELLCLGPDGGLPITGTTGLVAITLRFSYQKNAIPDFPVPGFDLTEKQGWDYLWVRYRDKEDTANHVWIKEPIGVYYERVFKRTDAGAHFGNL